MVQLTSDLVEALDDVARRRGTSRSALIREFVSDGLEQSGAAAVGERIAEGYRRIPQLEPDEWGDVGAATEIATGELLVRLDAEDRTAGHDAW